MEFEQHLGGKVRLANADSRDALKHLADNSIDAVVTDPPYALVSIVKRFGKNGSAPAKGNDAYARASAGFMGQTWDTGETAFAVEFWAEVMRVLKPGGHVVAASGTRTYHRLAVAIEDAGFEIRDMVSWLYGTGFPKSHNAGDGWGTALKPACEPWVLARKPLIGTVAANVLAHGTGALNIDGCRIDGVPWKAHTATGLGSKKFFSEGEATEIEKSPHEGGRWPANVIHDGSDEVVEGFPSSAGSGKARTLNRGDRDGEGWGMGPAEGNLRDAGSGSAARFFYSAKASKADRAGSKHPTVKPISLMRYLCRLVTPPGGVILDPFAGTGTTGQAAYLEGFEAVLIEREPEFADDIRRRLKLVHATTSEIEITVEAEAPLAAGQQASLL